MTQERIATILNEWERRYIADPKAFGVEFQTVIEFLAEEASGQFPSYGASGAAYMAKLDSELP
jgi:hypothetical protein